MYQTNTQAIPQQNTMTKEEFLFHQSICRALEEVEINSQDPSYEWLTLEEFWEGFEDD